MKNHIRATALQMSQSSRLFPKHSFSLFRSRSRFSLPIISLYNPFRLPTRFFCSSSGAAPSIVSAVPTYSPEPVVVDDPSLRMHEVYDAPKAFRWVWKPPKPQNVLIVQKPSPDLLDKTETIINIIKDHAKTVVVCDPLHESFPNLPRFNASEAFGPDQIDLVVCLGGDGTFLYASSLFEKRVPPMLSFSLGTLGFLTPFSFSNAKETLETILRTNECYFVRRLRLYCKFIRRDGVVIKQTEKVLNEVFITRGDSPVLTNINCYCDGALITTVRADGVIIATPTGSTAYSLSAGGPLIHPSIPAILLNPICPHSLSFRPVVLPANADLCIENPAKAKYSVLVQFDGRNQMILSPGDAVLMTVSKWAVPAICKTHHTSEWFKELAVKLNWNALSRVDFRSEE